MKIKGEECYGIKKRVIINEEIINENKKSVIYVCKS